MIGIFSLTSRVDCGAFRRLGLVRPSATILDEQGRGSSAIAPSARGGQGHDGPGGLLRLRSRRTSFLASRRNSLAIDPVARGVRKLGHSGFSLVEVMIVIALVALISAVAIPSLTNVLRSSRDEFSRHLALSLREARDRAMLQHKLLRLRIDFENQQYWFEEAPSNYLKPKAADRSMSEADREAQKKTDSDAFREVTELAKEKQKLPKGLRIQEVISPRHREPIREGVTDIYFYDNGNTDGATIHFEDEEKVRSAIRLHPITGQSKYILGYEEGKP